MRNPISRLEVLVWIALLAGLAQPAQATTLRRASLESLAADHQTVVLGEVLAATSYWSEDGTTILTDVRFAPAQTLKGRAQREITVTLLGGQVGDRTVLILGGPELIPGRSYLLFLNTEDLPGAAGATTVRELCQGVFEIDLEQGQLKASSQANRHPLMPDASGATEPPGGRRGLSLDTLISTLRSTLASQADTVREMKR